MCPGQVKYVDGVVGIVRATTICRRITGVRGREEKMSKKGEIVVAVGIEVVAFQRQGCDPPQGPASGGLNLSATSQAVGVD